MIENKEEENCMFWNMMNIIDEQRQLLIEKYKIQFLLKKKLYSKYNSYSKKIYFLYRRRIAPTLTKHTILNILKYFRLCR